jgi:hypothetical protein
MDDKVKQFSPARYRDGLKELRTCASGGNPNLLPLEAADILLHIKELEAQVKELLGAVKWWLAFEEAASEEEPKDSDVFIALTEAKTKSQWAIERVVDGHYMEAC